MKPAQNFYAHLTFWASCAGYAFVFVCVCAAHMDNSVLFAKNPLSHFTDVYPARWNFYVGSLHEPVYKTYEVKGHKLTLIDIRPFTSKFLYGVDSKGKIMISEIELIATDTAFLKTASKYTIQMPVDGKIDNYIQPDTLKYNTYHSENVRYMKGQMLLTIQDCPLWQEKRERPSAMHSITIVPLNIQLVQ